MRYIVIYEGGYESWTEIHDTKEEALKSVQCHAANLSYLTIYELGAELELTLQPAVVEIEQ